MKQLFCTITILLGLVGCGALELYQSDNSPVLAKVNHTELRESQVPEIYSANMTYTDSIIARNLYVQQWVENEAIATAALNAVKKNEQTKQEIETLVQAYRKRLMVQALEKEYTDQKLDTIVTENQIKNYYNNNKSHYRLSSPLVRSIVVRLPEGLRQGERLKEMFLTGNDQQLIDFIDICAKNNYQIDDKRNKWEPFTTTIAQIPLRVKNLDEFLRKNRTYTITENGYVYLMRIEKYLPSGSLSPLEIEKDRIIVILRNIQKKEMIQTLNDSIVHSAYRSGNARVFTSINE